MLELLLWLFPVVDVIRFADLEVLVMFSIEQIFQECEQAASRRA